MYLTLYVLRAGPAPEIPQQTDKADVAPHPFLGRNPGYIWGPPKET